MIYPDEHSDDLVSLLSQESDAEKLSLLEVDLALVDVSMSLATCGVHFESDVDLYLVTQHLRVAYIVGHKDGAKEQE